MSLSLPELASKFQVLRWCLELWSPTPPFVFYADRLSLGNSRYFLEAFAWGLMCIHGIILGWIRHIRHHQFSSIIDLAPMVFFQDEDICLILSILEVDLKLKRSACEIMRTQGQMSWCVEFWEVYLNKGRGIKLIFLTGIADSFFPLGYLTSTLRNFSRFWFGLGLVCGWTTWDRLNKPMKQDT